MNLSGHNQTQSPSSVLTDIAGGAILQGALCEIAISPQAANLQILAGATLLGLVQVSNFLNRNDSIDISEAISGFTLDETTPPIISTMTNVGTGMFLPAMLAVGHAIVSSEYSVTSIHALNFLPIIFMNALVIYLTNKNEKQDSSNS
jgi:hypothetical protein